MPVQAKKKVTKPKAVTKPKKVTKAKKVAKPKAAAKKSPALECRVCGYRVIVDQACGCAEEHTLVCCGQPMSKK